jgi:PASTA domain
MPVPAQPGGAVAAVARRGVRRTWVVALVCAAAWTVPAAARAACAADRQMLKVSSYSGTASVSWVSGQMTGQVNGASFTLSIDRSAQRLQISGLRQGAIAGATFGNLLAPTGGTVTVDDSFLTGASSSTATASGATVAGGDGDGVQVLTNPAACTYQLLISFAIATQTDAVDHNPNAPIPPDVPGVEDGVTSPSEPIPSNLALDGSAGIPAPLATAGAGGGWEVGTDPAWPATDQTWARYIGVISGGQPYGTATISWSLTPSHFHKPTACVVPKLVKLTRSAAAKALRAAGCSVGKIRRARSRKIAKGKVVSSRPKAGRRLKPGAKVALVISRGRIGH